MYGNTDLIKLAKYCFEKYAAHIKFSGRASRSEFFNYLLAPSCVIFILGFVENPIIVIRELLFDLPTEGKTFFLIDTMAPLIILFGILWIPVIFSIFVRRIHDINASGWWLFLTCIFIVIEKSYVLPETMSFLVSLYFLVMIVLIFLRKGTDGDNRFGKDPLLQTK